MQWCLILPRATRYVWICSMQQEYLHEIFYASANSLMLDKNIDLILIAFTNLKIH